MKLCDNLWAQLKSTDSRKTQAFNHSQTE